MQPKTKHDYDEHSKTTRLDMLIHWIDAGNQQAFGVRWCSRQGAKPPAGPQNFNLLAFSLLRLQKILQIWIIENVEYLAKFYYISSELASTNWKFEILLENYADFCVQR